MKKIYRLSLALLVAVGFGVSTLGAMASAQPTPAPTPPPADNSLITQSECPQTGTDQQASKCVEGVRDPATERDCASASESCNIVVAYLNPFINVLAILAGLAVTAGIIVGGIQYASSGGDPQKAAEGKKHIKMAVIALVGFIFLYTFLKFLIPGSDVAR